MADAPSPCQGLRVLVVEDVADTSDTLVLLLHLEGHEVWVASDGPAALRQAGECEPDVVLLDLRLPGLDGWEVARRLCRQRLKKRPLLVAVTGYGQECDRRCSAEAGIDLHLVKPVDPERLLGLLKRFQQTLARPMAGAERRLRSRWQRGRSGLRDVADALRAKHFAEQAARLGAWQAVQGARVGEACDRAQEFLGRCGRHLAASRAVCRQGRARLDAMTPAGVLPGRSNLPA
jgi:two-component system OmpR family response regulator